ncbi:hypothetical protein J6590_011960, partial [Homalodisca vitripennis]
MPNAVSGQEFGLGDHLAELKTYAGEAEVVIVAASRRQSLRRRAIIIPNFKVLVDSSKFLQPYFSDSSLAGEYEHTLRWLDEEVIL